MNEPTTYIMADTICEIQNIAENEIKRMLEYHKQIDAPIDPKATANEIAYRIRERITPILNKLPV